MNKIIYDGIEWCRNSNNYYVWHKHNIFLRLHRYIYEMHYGEIPKGYEIHHKDGNKLNNNIDNLEILTKSEHTKLHMAGRTLSEKHKQKISESGKKRIFSEETKEKMRIAQRKVIRKKHSEETKQKMSEAWKKRSHEVSEETRQKLREVWVRRKLLKGVKNENYSVNIV